MRHIFVIIFISIVIILSGVSCKDAASSEEDLSEMMEEETEEEETNEETGEEDNKIFIHDQTGKAWDITHAVKKYGMVPEGFQFGLGPNAIPPINNPQMLSQGDVGYPGDSQTFIMIGTMINEDTRAYPLSVLALHEIVNEVFDDTHVSVAF